MTSASGTCTAIDVMRAGPLPGSLWRRGGAVYSVVCPAIREGSLCAEVVYRDGAGVCRVVPLTEWLMCFVPVEVP